MANEFERQVQADLPQSRLLIIGAIVAFIFFLR